MRIKCSKCKSILEVKQTAETHEVVCPICKNQLVIAAQTETINEESNGRTDKRRFSFKTGFLSEVFKKHKASEVEEYFMVGSSKTTPDIFGVDLRWPRPWMFARLLSAGVALYLVMVKLFEKGVVGLNNISSIPNIFVIGSFVVPLASAVLFFELNVRRNVTLYQVLRLIFMGGILSLILSTFFFEVSPWIIKTFGVPEKWQASIAGPVEESAKLVAVLLIVRGVRYRYIMNGMLFGAAVGVGFAMFESAGYALRSFLSAFAVSVGNGALELAKSGQLTDAAFHGKVVLKGLQSSFGTLNDVIVLRGILAPVGHVAYSAIAVGAMWRIRGGRPFSVPMLWDFRFVSLFVVAVALHFFWNSPLLDCKGIPWVKVAIVAGVEWVILGIMIFLGIRQIRQEQEDIVCDG